MGGGVRSLKEEMGLDLKAMDGKEEKGWYSDQQQMNLQCDEDSKKHQVNISSKYSMNVSDSSNSQLLQICSCQAPLWCRMSPRTQVVKLIWRHPARRGPLTHLFRRVRSPRSPKMHLSAMWENWWRKVNGKTQTACRLPGYSKGEGAENNAKYAGATWAGFGEMQPDEATAVGFTEFPKNNSCYQACYCTGKPLLIHFCTVERIYSV